MKKRLCFLLVGFLLLFLIACTPQKEQTEGSANTQLAENTGESMDYASMFTVPYQSEEYYEIYTDATMTGFYYIVKDKNGTPFDQGFHNARGSFGLEYRNGMLVLDYGHGGNAWSERYYDISHGCTSDFFERPVASSDKLVAYFASDDDSQIVLVVQDIFDPSAYYTQVQRDFSDSVFKDNQYKGEFLENNTMLKITYPVINKEEVVTETIPLTGRSATDEMLLEVLYNKRPFVDEAGTEGFLSDYKWKRQGLPAVPEKYTFVDMDGDDTNELVVYVTPEFGFYLVFHIDNGNIYGYGFGVRTLINLKTDGTFADSAGAGIVGFYSVYFRGNKCESVEKAFINDMEHLYRLNGTSATEEDAKAFSDAFYKKEDVTWMNIS